MSTPKMPELTPEQRVFAQRMMASRALGQDFANIIARTGVAPDLAVVVSMTTLSINLMNLAKVDKGAAQDAVNALIVEFGALCKGLGLSLDGDTEPEQPAEQASN